MAPGGTAAAVRKAAFITLFFLGSVNVASLSALHVDLPQSHAVQCEVDSPRSDCHADLPHQHDSAHAGEESLFEYIFQVSREAPVIGLAFCLAPALLLQVCAPLPVVAYSFPLPAVARQPLPAPDTRQLNPRAPPIYAQA